jgi:hypothetical protein
LLVAGLVVCFAWWTAIERGIAYQNHYVGFVKRLEEEFPKSELRFMTDGASVTMPIPARVPTRWAMRTVVAVFAMIYVLGIATVAWSDTGATRITTSPSVTDWIQAGGAIATLVVTVVLAYLTRKSVAAAAAMTEVAARDCRERHRVWLDMAVKTEFRADSTYTMDIALENKGLTPLRVDRLTIAAGRETLYERRALVFRPGEKRHETVRVNVHELAWLHLKEGERVPVQVRVEYRDGDSTPQVLVNEPVLHNQKTPRPHGSAAS